MAAITFGDISREHRRSFPDRLAVIDGKGRADLAGVRRPHEQGRQHAHRPGVGAGDRVLWLAQSSACFLELLIGCAKVGAMVCPVNWRQSGDELRFVIEDFAPQVIVWQEEEIGAAVAAGAAPRAQQRATWLQFDGEGEGSFEHAVLSPPHDSDVEIEVSADAPAARDLHGGHHRPSQRVAC